MEKRKVISYKQLPTRMPSVIWTGAILWLLLDRFQPKDWVWGAAGTIWLLVLVATVAAVSSERLTDVKFKDED